MKTLQKILTYIFSLLSGMTTASLLITRTEDYKIYLSMILCILVVKLSIYESNKLNNE